MNFRRYCAIGVIVAAVLIAQNSSANPPIGNGTLNGVYEDASTGLLWFNPPGGTPIKYDVSDSSILQFDGMGHFNGRLIQAVAMFLIKSVPIRLILPALVR
jgi:hypothetical protein